MAQMRVLLVDDEKELVMTMAERLRMRGIEAEWATSAEGALELLGTHTFDVAVLDVKIPKVSGLALKKKIEERRPGMKFLFLTGHGSHADFKRGSAEAGPEYYLVKPISIEDLISKMECLTRRKEG